jgi:hypothetical protein
VKQYGYKKETRVKKITLSVFYTGISTINFQINKVKKPPLFGGGLKQFYLTEVVILVQ